MSSPRVSVVMGVRNGEDYLAHAIGSILAQTLDDLELIVVDDGSVDGSAAIVKGLQRTDSRVVLESTGGRGLASALNLGISMARGEWIARMDADDIANKHRLSRQLQFAEHERLDICGCDVRTFGATLPRVRSHFRGQSAISIALLFGSPFSHPTVLGRKSLFVSTYDEKVTAAQDYALWVALARRGARMGNLQEPLLRYRIHGRQVTQRKTGEQIDAAVRVARDYWLEMLQGASGERERFVDERVLRGAFDKSLSVPDDVAITLVQMLSELALQFGNPERVVAQNLFKVLIRASPAVMREPAVAALLPMLGATQRALLLAKRLIPVDWESAPAQRIRQFLR